MQQNIYQKRGGSDVQSLGQAEEPKEGEER